MDYTEFLKELETNVNYFKKYEKWQETDKIKGYDVLINELEEGFSEQKYDESFYLIETELVPFINIILQQPKKYNPKLDTLTFPIEKQKNLTTRIAKTLGYDFSVGCIREGIRTFSTGENTNDVRIATTYDEKLFFSNIYSNMHEFGHALQQLQMNKNYSETNIFENITCASGESQSRF